MIGALIQQLLRSRLALLGVAGGGIGLIGAATVRLIPWTLVLVILVLAIVGVVAFVYLRQWWGRRKDAQFASAMDAQGQGAMGQSRLRDRAQIEALQAQWKEQFAALQRSKIGKQKRFVYFLPWYAIIGAPACGKTTAIENSGLNFPGGQPKLRGTGGTKNCDWWFAEQCILLDTAGRYAFNEESAPDLDEWLEFLKLLKKYRPIAPINGLIVAVSADELLGKEEDDLVESARTIRDKLDQLVRELGIQFPVYLLVTKCDLVEGFAEFFGRLPKNRLDEMLGWTNPSWEMGDPQQLVRGALAGLGERIRAMRPELLRTAEQREHLRAIYVFPEEFAALEQRLVQFGDVLFRETQYNESPFLRGIYFTSGLQKGTAVSAMLRRLGWAQATELPEQKQSFFLKDFFSLRLSADKNLVATTGRVRGRAQVVNNVGLAVIVTAAILFGVVTGGSYVANRTLLNELEDEMVAATGTTERPPADTLAALGRYVGVLERLEDRNRRRPLLAGWGLWTGDGVIEPARKLFLDRFERDAFRPATDRARAALKARDEQRGFPALEALIRNYVLGNIVRSGQPVPGPNDALASFWSPTGDVSPEIASQFGRGYFAYLAWRAPETARAEQASDLVVLREALPEMFTVDRVAGWTERATCTTEAGARPCYPPLRARDAVPAAIANEAQVRGAFRPEAWPGHVEPLVTAVEALGGEIDPELVPRFRDGFRDRYFEAWLRFLAQPKVVTDREVPIETQLGNETPYLRIGDVVAGAMPFDAGTGHHPTWADSVTRVMGKRVEYLANLTAVGKQVRGGRGDPPAALDDARAIFARRTVVGDEEGDPPPDPFGKTERWVRQLVRRSEAVDAEDAQARGRLEELLMAPIYEGFRVYVDAAATAIDRQWERKIVPMPTETCDDIQALYRHPGGAIPDFVTAVMEPFFEPGGYVPKVRYRARLERSMGWLPAKEAQVRKNCGGGGGGGGGGGPCNVFFTSIPTGATPDGLFATRTVLRIYCGGGDPKVLEHQNYPAKMHLIWGKDDCSRAEVSVSAGHQPGDERPLEPRSGESLPAFLKAADIQEGSRFGWEFPGGVKAVFEITQTPPSCLFRSTEGTKPPGALPKS